MMWLDPLIPVARATVEALFNGLWQGMLLCALVACGLACIRRTNAATEGSVSTTEEATMACEWAGTGTSGVLPFCSAMAAVNSASRGIRAG